MTNISGEAGIEGSYQAPQFWGPPTLSFSSGFTGLIDGNYSLNHNTTNQVGENILWVRNKHNVTFGADFRRLDFNQLSQQNPRGSFTFTGAASGYDFADFLLGHPDTLSIAYGNADKYFRTSWWDTFVTDDWRLNSRVSLNIGVRWDFQAPVTESPPPPPSKYAQFFSLPKTVLEWVVLVVGLVVYLLLFAPYFGL